MTKIAFVSSFGRGKVSGPVVSVTSLAKNLRDFNGYETEVYSDSPVESSEIFNGVYIRSKGEFCANINNFDCVVFEGVYKFSAWQMAALCREKNIPYVISPRSNLMRESLKKGRFKKSLAYAIYIRKYLLGATSIHFLSQEERLNSIDAGIPCFIARNGCELLLPNGENARSGILYVGRYDLYHKGLDILLRAIQQSVSELRNNKITIDFYGSDYRGGAKYLNDFVSKRNLKDVVSIHGPIFGQEKKKLMESFKYFIHCSRYEGQPQAVIEAMSLGLIPIVTAGCNMQFVIERWGGVSVGFASESNVAIALKQICNGIGEVPDRVDFLQYFSWEQSARIFKEGLEEALGI